MVSTVSLGLYRSWQRRPPPQNTRVREGERTRLVPVFSALAALSFTVAAYSAIQYATLSYQVWADQRSIEVPHRYALKSWMGRAPY